MHVNRIVREIKTGTEARHDVMVFESGTTSRWCGRGVRRHIRVVADGMLGDGDRLVTKMAHVSGCTLGTLKYLAKATKSLRDYWRKRIGWIGFRRWCAMESGGFAVANPPLQVMRYFIGARSRASEMLGKVVVRADRCVQGGDWFYRTVTPVVLDAGDHPGRE